MLLPLRAQAALKPVGLLEYVQSDTCLVLDWVRKTWAKWSYKSCTRMCAHVFFSRFVSLYCPRFNFGSRSGSVWTCAVHPLKSCYGRGKDVYKINCQAFSMLLSLRPHHLLCFFPIVREIMKCCCHCQQRKHRSWSCTLV